MKLRNVMKNTMSIIKDEPLNVGEKIELLEKKMNAKLSQFEYSISTMHSIIIKLSEENSILKEENLALKQMMANRETQPTLLDGIKERLIKPIINEGKEFAELILEEKTDKHEYKIKPESELDKYKKAKEPKPIENSSNPKENTIKWMRQKFGLSPHITDKKQRAVRKKAMAKRISKDV